MMLATRILLKESLISTTTFLTFWKELILMKSLLKLRNYVFSISLQEFLNNKSKSIKRRVKTKKFENIDFLSP
jgi:hypothetical protein